MAPPVSDKKDTGNRCHECNFPDQVIKGRIWKKTKAPVADKPQPKPRKTIADFFGDGPKPTVTDGKAFEPAGHPLFRPETKPLPTHTGSTVARLTQEDRPYFPTGSVTPTEKKEVMLPTKQEEEAAAQRLIATWCVTSPMRISPDKDSPSNGTYNVLEVKPNTPKEVLVALHEALKGRYVSLPGGGKAYQGRELYISAKDVSRAFHGVRSPQLVAVRHISGDAAFQAVDDTREYHARLDALSAPERKRELVVEKALYRLTHDPIVSPKKPTNFTVIEEPESDSLYGPFTADLFSDREEQPVVDKPAVVQDPEPSADPSKIFGK